MMRIWWHVSVVRFLLCCTILFLQNRPSIYWIMTNCSFLTTIKIPSYYGQIIGWSMTWYFLVLWFRSNLKISWSCGQCSMSCKRSGHGCLMINYFMLRLVLQLQDTTSRAMSCLLLETLFVQEKKPHSCFVQFICTLNYWSHIHIYYGRWIRFVLILVRHK